MKIVNYKCNHHIACEYHEIYMERRLSRHAR